MKIYFTLSTQQGCYFVRSMIPMIAGGWNGDQTSLLSAHLNGNQMAQACMDADVVVFHRPNDDRCLEIADKLRQLGKKIVMDSDDTYKDIDGQKWQYLLNKVDGYLDKFGREADMITCSTEFLAKEYRALNKNVVVLPNTVDPDFWPDEDEILRNDGEKVRIGFVGSVAYGGDFSQMQDALMELNKREDVQLVLFGLPPKTEGFMKVVVPAHKKEFQFWESLNIEWQPLVPMKDYIQTLNELKLDLMVIPRGDRYFNRCKSNLKFLEASMLEIPVIAQGFSTGDSPYQQNPEDANRMVIITDNNEWLPAINKMVENKEMRREIGKRAREYVIQNYSIEKHINKWEEAYKSL